MAILEKEVWVGLAGNIEYYEGLGYEIPRYQDKKDRLKVKRGTRILVNIKDMPDNSKVRVTKICDICGYKTKNQSIVNINASRNSTDGKDRCPKCTVIYRSKQRMINMKYENSLEYYAKEHEVPHLINEWSNRNNKKPSEVSFGSDFVYWWNCSNCKNEYDMSIGSRTGANKSGCPYCCIPSKRVLVGFNDLWSTHPSIASLLKNTEMGYQLSYGSSRRQNFICPICNYEIKNRRIDSIIRQGFSCPRCSDGISYPEKIMIHTLCQLEIEFETQKVFEWSKNKKYDFYVPSLNMIIETHGNQHYDGNFKSYGGRTLQDEQENDRLKEKLAKENGIKHDHYIVIDCRKSELEWIKNNIVKSRLIKHFDFSNVNWMRCHEFACKTLVKISCDLYNKGINLSEIGTKLKISRPTVIKYLKQGEKLGWCEYYPKKEMQLNSHIVGKLNGKKVVKLSLAGDFLDEFPSTCEAHRKLGIPQGGISLACRGKLKTSGNYKWMYKEDYDQYIKQTQINS